MQYFTGPKTLEVPPKAKAEYEVAYFPLTMTKDFAAAPPGDDEEAKSVNSVQ